jgi:hypothetical protein
LSKGSFNRLTCRLASLDRDVIELARLKINISAYQRLMRFWKNTTSGCTQPNGNSAILLQAKTFFSKGFEIYLDK